MATDFSESLDPCDQIESGSGYEPSIKPDPDLTKLPEFGSNTLLQQPTKRVIVEHKRFFLSC